jgi:hypothetical protein
MFFQRTVIALSRRAPARALSVRPFSSSIIRANQSKWQPKQEGKILPFEGSYPALFNPHSNKRQLHIYDHL